MREAVALYRGQGKGGGVSWVKVSSHMGGTRSTYQCYVRWHDTLKLADSGLIKEGAWAEDEVSVIHPTIITGCICGTMFMYIVHTASILCDNPLYNSKYNNVMIKTGHKVA